MQSQENYWVIAGAGKHFILKMPLFTIINAFVRPQHDYGDAIYDKSYIRKWNQYDTMQH